ncbi:hypothetical protein [Cryobacterium tepidiphilum]|uniref:Large exoprotein n=1 Tax=Cryobacterium tepidiphilum TaxID=2486026 RepID=A0A3M8KUR9_9MICO|nr:hypothetical protein [Cryobacterium tepidiphilum]RNE57003.1 hypothetical protein EEJ31_12650 [Cryobacterium tepidiphilum]
MQSEVFGGGVMVAVAAALWIAYLVPAWSRWRQYLATERNAVRLQQTLRILAETSEVPGVVRVEANARAVSSRQRMLAQAEADAEREAKAAVDAARAARRAAVARMQAEKAMRAEDLLTPLGQLRQLRRRRALSALTLLAGLALTVTGLVISALGGSSLLVMAGFALIVGAVMALAHFARQAQELRVVHLPEAVERPAAPARRQPARNAAEPAAPHTWTPQPLPRPLHLSRGSVAQAAMASVDAAADLRRAMAEDEIARKAASLATQTGGITPITAAITVQAPAGPPSRFASMGVVGETSPGIGDLDAVLRRRRAAS